MSHQGEPRPDRRACAEAPAAEPLRRAGRGRVGRAPVLRARCFWGLFTCGEVRRSHPQGSEASRSARRTADEDQDGNQPEDRKDARVEQTVKPSLFELSRQLPGSRVLDGRFAMEYIAMAMAQRSWCRSLIRAQICGTGEVRGTGEGRRGKSRSPRCRRCTASIVPS